MTSLTESAEAARVAAVAKEKDRRASEREGRLDKVIERWSDKYSGFGRLAADGYDVGPAPERECFTSTRVAEFKGASGDDLGGFTVEVDGVTFLLCTDYGKGGTYLVHQCPQCGVTGASSFHGLDDLGVLLKTGPKSYTHRCVEREARTVAYAIGTAARDLKIAPAEIVAEAFDREGDLIDRLRFGR